MYDANGIISFEYALDENGEEITINNITQTHKKIRMCRVSDFLPTTPIALVKVPALLNLSDNIQP
jgi:alpha-mannosidase